MRDDSTETMDPGLGFDLTAPVGGEVDPQDCAHLEGLVLSMLARLMLRPGATPRATPIVERAHATLAPYVLRRVTDYIEAHLEEDIGLADLAALATLSPFHFARAFKASTGLPPYRYLVRARIERAKSLLGAGDDPILEVAARVGYGDPGHFAKAFRAAVGLGPREFRRTVRRA